MPAILCCFFSNFGEPIDINIYIYIIMIYGTLPQMAESSQYQRFVQDF